MSLAIEDFKLIEGKGAALKASFSFVFPALGQTMKITDCLLFEMNGKQWFTFPSRTYKKEGDDKPSYFPYVRILTKGGQDAVRDQILLAMRACKGESQPNYNHNAHQQFGKAEEVAQAGFPF